MSRPVLGLIAVAVAVLLGTVLIVRGCREKPEVVPPEAIGDFEIEKIVLDSPDIDLALLSVRGTAEEGYTDWAFVFECRENRGCRAELRLEIEYESEGEKKRLSIEGLVDVDRGETARLGRIQRPAVVIDRIDRVTVAVVAPYDPPDTAPTPII